MSSAGFVTSLDRGIMADLDQELVIRAQQGDQEAFRALYEQTHRLIYSLLRHMTGDEELAADLTQETYVKAWQGLPSLRATKAFAGWLRMIATNLVRDACRRRKPETLLEDQTPAGEAALDIADNRPGAEELVILSEQQLRVRQAVATLPEPQRAVIILFHFEDIPVATIAEQLQIPLGTVLSRLARGREALKKRLEAGNAAEVMKR
jgi:RNA polymerase sigma-70 factor, ECF subfamily